ncbi:MAG: TfoX/Sxy family protein [Proteobacteria bacterium]|nr:TfoX/Sxy family protein [Pseudomonadota bacterium]
MASTNSSRGLADELPEVFARFGHVDVRRMFGGHGLFHEGHMFGIVAAGRVYLKTDEENRPLFEQKRLGPFEYARRGEMTATSYYEAPAEIFEDRDEAAHWARVAWGAVLRKGSGAGKRRTTGAKTVAKTVAKAPAKTAARKSARKPAG